MTATIKLDTDPYIQENNPYLFEDEDNFTRVEVDPPDYNGKITAYVVHPEYVSNALREHYRKLAANSPTNKWAARAAERRYQWSGIDLSLTPTQARKLAKALRKSARLAESRD